MYAFLLYLQSNLDEKHLNPNNKFELHHAYPSKIALQRRQQIAISSPSTYPLSPKESHNPHSKEIAWSCLCPTDSIQTDIGREDRPASAYNLPNDCASKVRPENGARYHRPKTTTRKARPIWVRWKAKQIPESNSEKMILWFLHHIHFIMKQMENKEQAISDLYIK